MERVRLNQEFQVKALASTIFVVVVNRLLVRFLRFRNFQSDKSLAVSYQFVQLKFLLSYEKTRKCFILLEVSKSCSDQVSV